MIVVRDEARGSGKTTYIIEELKKNPMRIALVPNREMTKLYPEKLRNRVLTFQQMADIFRSHRARSYFPDNSCSILIDECFFESTDLPYIYWWAGRMGIDVLAVGTTYKKMMDNLGRPFK